jgi:hypothetical protein
MSSYLETDFCSPDDGLDYIFGRMMAIFGASFARHFDQIDPLLVRQEWKKQLSRYLTYRPSMDFAIDNLDGNFVPSAIKFRQLCLAGPAIPTKPLPVITHQRTQAEIAATENAKAKALRLLAEFKGKYQWQEPTR